MTEEITQAVDKVITKQKLIADREKFAKQLNTLMEQAALVQENISRCRGAIGYINETLNKLEEKPDG